MILMWTTMTSASDVAPVVAHAAAELDLFPHIEIASIDPAYADTESMTELWGTDLFDSVNCVILTGQRGGEERTVACCVRATTKIDVNHIVKKELDVRKCSFMSTERAVEETGMAYGGITPLGLPWPIWIDRQVLGAPAIIGSGTRTSKLRIHGDLLATLPSSRVLDLTL